MKNQLIATGWGPTPERKKDFTSTLYFDQWCTAAGFHAADKWDDEIFAVMGKAFADHDDPEPWKKFNEERYAAGSKRADKFAKKNKSR